MIEQFPPCVGCGYCCITAPCFLSAYMEWHINSKQVCRKLVWSKSDQRYWCQAKDEYPEKLEHLGFGAGCPSVLGNKWRQNVKRRF